MIDKTWYQKINGVKERTCAGGIVVRKAANTILIALVGEKGLPGYVLPKGGVENKETLEQAAKREIAEEAGIREVVIITYLGKRERLTYHKSTWSTIHYFFCLTSQERGIPSDPEKDYSLAWFPLDVLPEMVWPEQKELIEENSEMIRKYINKYEK